MIGGAIRRAFALAMVLFAAGLVMAPPASAHTALESSTPKDGTRVDAPPDQVTLDFTEPIRTRLTRVSVRGPGGERFELGGPQSVSDKVTQALRPLTTAGEYEILYRVVAVDGHPLTGEVKFTLAQPGPGASADATASAAGTPPASPGTADNAGATSEDDGGVSPLLLAVVGLAVVVFVAGAVWFGKRVTRDVD